MEAIDMTEYLEAHVASLTAEQCRIHIKWDRLNIKFVPGYIEAVKARLRELRAA